MVSHAIAIQYLHKKENFRLLSFEVRLFTFVQLVAREAERLVGGATNVGWRVSQPLWPRHLLFLTANHLEREPAAAPPLPRAESATDVRCL
jgi:hypothetical protein